VSLSVIIPTYKNVKYLNELFESISKNNDFEKYEILVGVDSCEETLNYIKSNTFPENFKFYSFKENIGPYIIKNTLTTITNNDKLLFFDSDDIMFDFMLSYVDNNLDNFDCVKPKYIDFEVKNNEKIFRPRKNSYGEGVFGIKKENFLMLNGFEGWRVAADSDFMGRFYKTKGKVLMTSDVLFYRRRHSNSLTAHNHTGFGSELRNEYVKLSNKKGNKIVLDALKISSYEIIENGVIKNNKNYELNDNEYIIKLSKQKKISDLINSNTNKINVNKPKEIKKINYKVVNNTSNIHRTSILKNALKKTRLEQIKNR
jgi:hypothetical protein